VERQEAEALLADIRRQAESERERIVSEARARAERAREAAESEVRAMEAEAERQLGRRLELDRARIFGDLRLEERARRLRARRASIAKAFAKARAALADVDAARYRETLAELIREALASVGGDADLQVSRADLGSARAILSGFGLQTRVTDAGETPLTVVAVSRDGLRKASNGLESRLAAAETLLEEDVARILFGDT
jgi:vacuolar-type H+-ATPase subunit E/Vma4